jgi:hypothetical protein
MRILLMVCLAPILNAQGHDPWSELRSRNPQGASIILRLVSPHPYRQGELISAGLNLPDNPPAQAAPLPDQWQFAGILLDPPTDCGTLEKPCFVTDAGGLGFSLPVVGPGPRGHFDRQPVALNSYLPPLRPGRYQLAALARKLVLGNRGPASTSYVYADPPQYAVSDAVQIEIVASTADWVWERIARSVATLHGPQPADAAAYEAQQDAATQLAYLNDPASWNASLDLLPKEENILLTGLTRARPPAQICDLMQARVTAPAQSVSSSYLYRLTEICARANTPPPPTPAATTRPAAIVGVFSTAPPRVTAPAA